MPRRNAPPPRGIIGPGPRDAPHHGDHQRLLPCAALAPYVAHFWTVQWDVPQPVTAETLPHPCVHLLVEGARHEVSGVHARRFTRTLEGRGRVFGVKFRPAMFRAFLGRPVSTLANRVVGVEEVFGAEGRRACREVERAEDMPRRCDVAEALLLARMPPAPDEKAEALRDLVEAAATDTTLVDVAALVTRSGWPLRALQRGFREHVGATPKWVIQRYRLHEAAERLARDVHADMAALALELGYADQSHFVNDFRRVVGVAPGRYARRLHATGRGS